MADSKDNTVLMNLGDGAGKSSYDFRLLSGEVIPNGLFYKTSTLNNPLIEGVVLEDPYYSDVVYINTECIFQNFGEMQETFALLADVPKSEVILGCNKISFAGLEMEYVSHTETSINYTLSYAGQSCSVKHDFLYAYNEDDCDLAFNNYRDEYINGSTDDYFDFEQYDQDIHTSSECKSIIENFYSGTTLAKSAATSSVDQKQINAVLRAVGSRIRKGK